MLLDRLKMEFIGSFVIIYFIGITGVNLITNITNMIGYGVSIFFIITILTWIGKPISGAHFNPIITIPLIITNHIELTKGIFYLIF